MRTDFTLLTADGIERDLAVLAPPGTRWRAVLGPLAEKLSVPAQLWCGTRALQPDDLVGAAPLVTGAVLAHERGRSSTPSSRWLEVVGGVNAGLSVPLRRPVVVGRDPLCELVVTDPRASRRHAAFAVAAAGVTVADLGSTDGTSIDGSPVAVVTPVTAGSVVRVGDTFLAIGETTADPPGRPHPADPGQTTVVALPAEPTESGAPRTALLATVLPGAAAAGLAAALGSWQLLAFAALAPVAAVGTLLGERRSMRRSHRRALSRYRTELGDAHRAISVGLRAEESRRRARYPGPPGLLRIATAASAWAPDDDGLRVRVGLGKQSSELAVTDHGREHPAGAANDVPVTVDLADGCLGVVGPPGLRNGLARWLVSQAALRNPPGSLGIAFVDPAPSWEWARWLPHVGTAPLQGRILRVLDARHWRSDLGPIALVLAGRRDELPHPCAQLLLATSDATVLVRRLAGAATPAVADQVSITWAERFARALAAVDAAAGPVGTALPSQCRLLDLLGDPDPTADSVRERWQRGRAAASTVIGVGSRGIVTIDLDRDGPHALIAGSTGSGKSELLQSLVAGLAMEHPPSELSFLLVDYKGGAAFAACADLPHTVGLVTDLDAHLTRRVLTALGSEIRRRERILAGAAQPDLASYRRLPDATPLARLVIVVDEFAALAEELGGFVSELVGIARRGRSLGLHLVLATQRPAGVVSAEIRANTALRICLRVTSAAESLDVVDASTAADIDPDTPGRGYLRSGTAARAFQGARVAAATPTRRNGTVVVLPLDGWRRPLASDEPDERTDLQRIVSATQAAVGMDPAIAAPHRPWQPPLPERLDVSAIKGPLPPGMVPVGLVDMPEQQRQVGFGVDLAAGEIVLVIGRARSGRSTVLRTVAHSATLRRSPDELQICGIDATGAGLASLRALPHAATVATADDGYEFTARLVERLAAHFAARRAAATPHPPHLLLIDGWDQLVAAAEDYDGGRSVERLLGMIADAPAAGATVVIAGGRATASPRLTTLCTTRLLLALTDPGEYAVAGVPTDAVPTSTAPGRGVRTGDRAEVQIAQPPVPDCSAPPSPLALRLRPLPRRVDLADIGRRRDAMALGTCGDDAAVAWVDLVGRQARMLVAGPPRSGRTTLLCTLLAQAGALPTLVAAPQRSPLARFATDAGMPVLNPGTRPEALPATGLVLVDDVEAYADSWLDDALADWADADVARRAMVVAGRADAITTAYRGLVHRIRAARCGLLLQPGPADGDLLGISVARTRATGFRPGRGLLVPDPSWDLGAEPLPIQVATP